MAYPQDTKEIIKRYTDFLKNKKVVVVGPAFHMKGWRQGKVIDSYDVIVRLSKGYEIDEKYKSRDIKEYTNGKYVFNKDIKLDFGSRTDILYQTMLPNWGNGTQSPINELKDDIKWICASFPDKRHRQCIIDFIKYNNNRIPMHIMDKKYWEKIRDDMRTIPSVGASAILDLLQYDIKEIYITGFNFYLAKDENGFFYYPDYFYGDKKHLKDNRPKGKHNHFKIFKYLKKLYERDKRIKCDKTLIDLMEKY